MKRENKIAIVAGVMLVFVFVWLFGAKMLADYTIENPDLLPVLALLAYMVLGGIVGSIIPISIWQMLSLEDEDEITGEPL